MQSQSNSRKRAAPGSSSMAQQQQQQTVPQPNLQFPQDGAGLGDQYTNQIGSDSFANAVFDPSIYGTDMFGNTQTFGANFTTAPNGTSNQLVRRNTNQQLTSLNVPQEQWTNQTPTPGGTAWEVKDDDTDLDRKAALAKKDAQAKRKQIPPFVLKLWSFLQDNRNTELIRWTDDGTAFTVLDEDEFARTLIPELFKHNNYASFVRQLNMYGFHKKVGLNANSMKAAEKKTKDPNVYWHEFFRQGREDLLWCIQKPVNKSSAKRKRGQDGKEHPESEDEKGGSPEVENQPVSQLRQNQQDLVTLPKTEVVQLRQEIQRLQRQQGLISQMITKLKDQNEQFYKQASDFQSMHERHENSINAILSFLATFYNRSMEAGVNLNNMFGSQQQQGSVVDVGEGEFADHYNTANNQLQRYKRPQLLLEGSPARDQSLRPGHVSTQPNSARASASPPSREAKNNRASLGAQSATSQRSNRASASPAIKDDAETPNMLNQYPDNEDMMSLLNAAHANSPSANSPQFDFSRALNHAQNANGQGPLTNQQREDMLNLIAQSQPGQPGAKNPLGQSNPPPMPDLEQYARTQEQLNMLTRLQQEQDSKVQNLAGRLQPLSPTGSIPGLHNGYGGAGQLGRSSLDPNPPSDFDIDAFINSDDNYFDQFGSEDLATAPAPTTTTDPTDSMGAHQVYGTTAPGNDIAGLDTGTGDDDTGLNYDFGTGGVGDDNDIGDDLFGEAGSGFGISGSQDVGVEGGRVESLHSSNEASPRQAGDEETPNKRQRRR